MVKDKRHEMRVCVCVRVFSLLNAFNLHAFGAT